MEVSGNKIFLGDQVPRGGGLLRFEAVKEYLAKKGLRLPVHYFVQDADTPNVNDGAHTLSIVESDSAKYWGLGVRFPFHPCVDKASKKNTTIQTLISVLVNRGDRMFGIKGITPRKGLGMLVGPRPLDSVFYGNHWWEKYDEQLLLKEIAWSLTLRSIITGESYDRVSLEETASDMIHLRISSLRSSSLVEHYKGYLQKQILDEMISIYGPKNFWAIKRDKGSSEYYRISLDAVDKSNYNDVEGIVPKGLVLPIALAKEGAVLAATGLPYLNKVAELRDKKEGSRGPDIEVMQIKFSWTDNEGASFLESVIRSLNKDRKCKGKKPLSVEFLNTDLLNTLKSRPTSVAYRILGGKLTTDIGFVKM